VTVEVIGNEENFLRRIPNMPLFMGSPKKERVITRHNFILRASELGVSGNIERLMSPSELLAREESSPDAKVARAQVGAIRELGFDVIFVEIDNNPGHAEIRPIGANLADETVQKALAAVFQFVQ